MQYMVANNVDNN